MHENRKNLWFLARWATGYAIDIGLTFGAVAVSLAALMVLPEVSANLVEAGHTTPGNIIVYPPTQVLIVLSIFAAVMAGRNWARNMYFTHILPEAWHDAVRDIIRHAQNEHDKKKDERP
jgi:hypothetical protein